MSSLPTEVELPGITSIGQPNSPPAYMYSISGKEAGPACMDAEIVYAQTLLERLSLTSGEANANSPEIQSSLAVQSHSSFPTQTSLTTQVAFARAALIHSKTEICDSPEASLPLVHQLPPELLCEIFLHSLPDSPEPGFVYTPPPRAVDAPLLLCQICSHWRKVALSLSSLWSSLSVTVSSQGQKPRMPLVKLWLARSRSHPLSLSLDSLGVTVPPHANDNDVLDAFIPHFHHMRQFRLFLMTHSFKSLLNIPESAAPILEHLHISMRYWGNAQTDRLSLLFRSPRLRHFGWRNHVTVDYFGLEMTMAQLTSISLNCPFTIKECIYILHRCPMLEQCTFSDVYSIFPTSWSLPPRFELEHLNSLSISTNLNLAPLWDRLKLPAVSAIVIEYDTTYHPPWPQAEFKEMLTRSSCALQSLVLDNPVICEDDLIECLRVITASLVEFHIDDMRNISITDNLLDMLTFRESSTEDARKPSCLCPNLQIIKICGCISSSTDGVFAEMVASQWSRSGCTNRTPRVACPTFIEIEFNPDLEEQHRIDIIRLKKMRDEGLAISLYDSYSA